MGPSFSSKQSSHQTIHRVQAATDVNSACPNKEQNHLQNSLLRRTQFWVRKTFSKPASLKRASLVAFPVAMSHKVSVETKTLRFFNPDAKNFAKMNLNTVLEPHAHFSKSTKEKHFHGPIDRLVVPKMRPQNRKINSKGRPVQTKIL